MKPIQLAKSEESFRILDQWHQRFESSLSFEFQTQRVETSFGFTDVMVTGRDDETGVEDLDPVIVLHGAMAGAPFAMGELGDLPSRRRFHAVNIPGQSTRAEQVRMDFRTDEYGRWLGEVMDGLNIDRATVCGVSWGGCVALQMAKHFPERIRGMVLMVPGSIVNGPVLESLWSVALPMLRFKLFPTDRNRDRAFQRILTNKDALWSPYLGDAVRHWNVDFRVPPLIGDQDLRGLEAPVFVIAADRDLSFPGEKLIQRAEKLFPQFVGSHLLVDCHHSPSFRDEDRAKLAEVFEGALDRVGSSSPSLTSPVSTVD